MAPSPVREEPARAARVRGGRLPIAAILAVLGLLSFFPVRLALAAVEAETVRVAAVVAADRLQLLDGRTVRLAGVIVPGTLGDDPRAQPVARDAHNLVQKLTADAELELHSYGLDRQARVVGDLELPAGGGSLADRLLRAGLAWVDGATDLPGRAGRLESEAAAKEAGRGLWSMEGLGIQDAGRVRATPARYAVVQGTVAGVRAGDPWTYLNFGDDWRRDFTVRMSPAVAKLVKRAGSDPAKLGGQRLRVRGWLLDINGPMIEIVGPGQLEVLP